jgi:hypothetical protein
MKDTDKIDVVFRAVKQIESAMSEYRRQDAELGDALSGLDASDRNPHLEQSDRARIERKRAEHLQLLMALGSRHLLAPCP